MGLVLLTPVDWQHCALKDGQRRLFTGGTAAMIDDAAALAGQGLNHLSLIFQTAEAQETQDRMQRFAEEVLPALG